MDILFKSKDLLYFEWENMSYDLSTLSDSLLSFINFDVSLSS